MNTAADLITLEITALSHDGRGIARLAPTDGQGRATVVFVTHALPGQRVIAKVTRRKASFMEAEKHELLQEASDATLPICPHHAACGGCPLQTMPYEQQLYWKRTIALDALSRIGGLDRAMLENLMGPVAASPATIHFRNKMEFAFGHDSSRMGELVLGLRKRNGREVVAVPKCALMPAEALRMVDMFGELAAHSGFAAYIPPDARPGARPDFRASAGPEAHYNTDPRKKSGRPYRHDKARRAPGYHFTAQQDAADAGFWRFFVLRRGLAADLRTPRWWALCITSPGNAEQKAMVRTLGREMLAAFPQLSAFIHEERSTADTFAFGEKRVQTLDATGMDNPAAARLFQPLNGTFFALDAASFFQVNTAAAQTLARTARGMLAPVADSATPRGLLDLYCGVGAPGLLLAADYAALLGLEQDAKAVRLAKINAESNDQQHCQYEAGDAALRLERLATAGGHGMWAALHTTCQTTQIDNEAAAPLSAALAIGAPASSIPTTVTDALVDPPRAGLSPRALNALLEISPDRILYISCNPSTFARDAAQIGKHYRLEALAAVDLFPHTPHLECVSLWHKSSEPTL